MKIESWCGSCGDCNDCGCDKNMWEKAVTKLPTPNKADRSTMYIMPDNTMWALNYKGDELIQINKTITIESDDDSVQIERDGQKFNLRVSKSVAEGRELQTPYNSNHLRYDTAGNWVSEGAFMPWYDYEEENPKKEILLADIKLRVGSSDALGNGSSRDNIFRLNQMEPLEGSKTFPHRKDEAVYAWALEQFEMLFAVKDGKVSHIGKKIKFIGAPVDPEAKAQISWTKIAGEQEVKFDSKDGSIKVVKDGDTYNLELNKAVLEQIKAGNITSKDGSVKVVKDSEGNTDLSAKVPDELIKKVDEASKKVTEVDSAVKKVADRKITSTDKTVQVKTDSEGNADLSVPELEKVGSKLTELTDKVDGLSNSKTDTLKFEVSEDGEEVFAQVGDKKITVVENNLIINGKLTEMDSNLRAINERLVEVIYNSEYPVKKFSMTDDGKKYITYETGKYIFDKEVLEIDCDLNLLISFEENSSNGIVDVIINTKDILVSEDDILKIGRNFDPETGYIIPTYNFSLDEEKLKEFIKENSTDSSKELEFSFGSSIYKDTKEIDIVVDGKSYKNVPFTLGTDLALVQTSIIRLLGKNLKTILHKSFISDETPIYLSDILITNVAFNKEPTSTYICMEINLDGTPKGVSLLSTGFLVDSTSETVDAKFTRQSAYEDMILDINVNEDKLKELIKENSSSTKTSIKSTDDSIKVAQDVDGNFDLEINEEKVKELLSGKEKLDYAYKLQVETTEDPEKVNIYINGDLVKEDVIYTDVTKITSSEEASHLEIPVAKINDPSQGDIYIGELIGMVFTFYSELAAGSTLIVTENKMISALTSTDRSITVSPNMNGSVDLKSNSAAACRVELVSTGKYNIFYNDKLERTVSGSASNLYYMTRALLGQPMPAYKENDGTIIISSTFYKNGGITGGNYMCNWTIDKSKVTENATRISLIG